MTCIWGAPIAVCTARHLSNRTRTMLFQRSLRTKRRSSTENKIYPAPICKNPSKPVEMFPYSYWKHQPQPAGVVSKLQPGKHALVCFSLSHHLNGQNLTLWPHLYRIQRQCKCGVQVRELAIPRAGTDQRIFKDHCIRKYWLYQWLAGRVRQE